MPSDVVGNTRTLSSSTGEYVIPFFAPDGATSFNISNQYWYMENGWSSIGATADEMTFRIQALGVENYAYDIVMNPKSFLKTIKHGCPVIAVKFYQDSNRGRSYEVIWCGFVETIRQLSERGSQYCQVTATSAKRLLRDINVRGSYCWDGTKVVYRDAIPLHMNIGGRPDWTYSDDGIPMPAMNPDWGLTDDEQPNDDPQTFDGVAACNCTLGMLLQYLRAAYSAEGSESASFEEARTIAQDYYAGLDRLPDTFPFKFIWPSTFGIQVDQQIVANFNHATGQNNSSQGGARKGRDIRFRNGQPLVGNPGEMGVLDTIFAECGAYSYSLNFGLAQGNNEDSAQNITLECVPTRVVDLSQALPLYYAGGIESEMPNIPLIREFDFVESSKGTYSRLIGVGSSVKIERRVDTTEGQGVLIGWTQEDFDQFCFNAVVDGDTSEELMKAALAGVPHLFSRYLVDPDFDFSSGTDYESFPLASAPRPVWPFLLSYQGAEISTQANDIVPYPVRLEVSPAFESGWVNMGVESDGFISWDNGYFEFQALREIGISQNDTPDKTSRYGAWSWGAGNDNAIEDYAWGGVKGGSLNIELNDIRLTVAIPHDATLDYATKVPADSIVKASEDQYHNAPDSPDANRMDQSFTRTMIVDFRRLYDLWLRINSYPIPEAVGGTQAVDKPKLTDAVRSNYDLLVQNCQKSLYERNRLERSGYFKFIGPLLATDYYPLGQQIGNFTPIDGSSTVDPFPLNCCISMIKWSTRNLGTKEVPKWTSETELVPI